MTSLSNNLPPLVSQMERSSARAHPISKHGIIERITQLVLDILSFIAARARTLINSIKAAWKRGDKKTCPVAQAVLTQPPREPQPLAPNAIPPRLLLEAGAPPPPVEIPPDQFGQAEGLLQPAHIKFEKCDRQEVLNLQNQIQQTNVKYPKLDLSTLSESQMPIHKMKVGEVTYYCSQPFLNKQNASVLALVKIGDKVFPRTFYCSKSQVSWRAMPSVQKKQIEHGNPLGHINKGHFESDTQLPFVLNLALLDLKISSDPIHTIGYQKIANLLETELMNYRPPANYIHRVNKTPFAWKPEGAPDHFHNKDGDRIPLDPNPHDSKMPQDVGLHPDFSTLLYSRDFEDRFYGKLTAKVYASKDKNLQFLFHEAADGRAYLAGIEKIKDNPINTYGVRKYAVEAGMFTSPLLEYHIQIAPGYEASEADRYHALDDYGNNWNYVCELEIIKMYYNEQRREIPPKFKSAPKMSAAEQNNNVLQMQIDFHKKAAQQLIERAQVQNPSEKDREEILQLINAYEKRINLYRQKVSEREYNAIMGELAKAIATAKAALNVR